jgi:hypothetical protein
VAQRHEHELRLAAYSKEIPDGKRTMTAEQVVDGLEFLATVEHALIVEYL